MKKPLKPLISPQGAAPAAFGYMEASAIQAFASGKADEGQQKIAYRWIMEGACALPVWPYKESQRETDLALGRHFVGHQIMGLVRVNLSQLRQREEK